MNMSLDLLVHVTDDELQRWGINKKGHQLNILRENKRNTHTKFIKININYTHILPCTLNVKSCVQCNTVIFLIKNLLDIPS